MSTDELTEVIDQDVILAIDYQVGQPLDLVESVGLTALAGGIGKPGNPGALVGVAEGDFLQTATLEGAIVFDQSGNPVPGAVVLSDSGFDYVHPGAVQPGSAVPEPGSLLLALVSFSGFLFGLRRRGPGKCSPGRMTGGLRDPSSACRPTSRWA